MVDNDLVKSLKAALYDRTSSPLFGSFVLSWLVWNHRFIFLMLDGMSVLEKFAYVDQILYPNFWWSILQLFIGPLITGVLFIYVYPGPAQIIFRHWKNQQKKLNDIKVSIDNEKLLTREESKRLRASLAESQIDYENDLKQKSDEIGNFKEALKNSQVLVENLGADLSNAKNANPLTQLGGHSNETVMKIITSEKFMLTFNPKTLGTKEITFGHEGEVLTGNNGSENSWGVSNGQLEIFKSEGKFQNRFLYLPQSNIFISTNDKEAAAIKGQYMVPLRT